MAKNICPDCKGSGYDTHPETGEILMVRDELCQPEPAGPCPTCNGNGRGKPNG